MSNSLKIINAETDPRWDQFVFEHPQGSIYQHSLWGKVLSSTFGHTPLYVGLEKDDTHQLAGVVPFMFISSKLTGKRIVSLPFTAYIDPLAPDSELERIINYVAKGNSPVDFVELKLGREIRNTTGYFKSQSSYVTHVLDLDKDLNSLFNSFHKTSCRQRIKRAERNGLKLRIAKREEDLKKFYHLLVSVRRKQGLPPHPYSFFSNMWNILGPRKLMLVPLIEHQGRILAGAIVLRFKSTFSLEYTASDQNSLRISPNQLLIWETIKIACSEGATILDFGRSSLTHTSLIESKERWGTIRIQLQYYYYPSATRMDTEHGVARRILSFTNRYLPNSLLRLQGEILYPHIG